MSERCTQIVQLPVFPKGQYRFGRLLCCVAPIAHFFPGLATWGLSMTIHGWVAPVAEILSERASTSCSALVERAEKLVLADLDVPLHISVLCRALAVSERTLRKAFHRTYGVPPCRRLRMLRLSQARGALLSADGKFVTVTEIATGFGFVELGRFSVEYRKIFGESPSQTLYRASPTRHSQPTAALAAGQCRFESLKLFRSSTPSPALNSGDRRDFTATAMTDVVAKAFFA